MRLFTFIFIVALQFILGFRIFSYYTNIPKYEDLELINTHGSITSIPVESTRSQRFVLGTYSGGVIYVTTSPQEEYYYGQKLSIQGVVRHVVLGATKQINTVSFPKILVKDPSGLNERIVDWFYRQSDGMRDTIILFYERNLPRNSAAFLSGVVLGVDDGMSKEYRESLINLGVIHVVAASGMNVSIVASVFFVIFGSFMNRKLAVIFSIVAIAFYIVLAGGQASIVRAGIMGCIAFGAGLLGRQYFSMLALFLTGVGMIIISPSYIFDVGFQLSFISTFGLLILPGYIKKISFLGSKVKIFGFIRDDLLLTLSAQIATLPILFYYFGSYNLLSIIVNLLVLWVIPPIMILGGIAALFGLALPVIGQIALLIIIPFLFYFEWLIGLFSNLGSDISIELPVAMVFAYYFLLGAVLIFKRSRRSEV